MYEFINGAVSFYFIVDDTCMLNCVYTYVGSSSDEYPSKQPKVVKKSVVLS